MIRMSSPTTTRLAALTIAGLAVAFPVAAFAQDETAPPPSDAPASETASGEVTTTTEGGSSDREFRFELGAFVGAHFFADEHGLGRDSESDPEAGPKSGLMFGARLGFNFNKWFAVEAEGSLTPTTTRDEFIKLWVAQYRGHFLLNIIPRGKFRPFVLAGFGGQSSVIDDESVARSDTDNAFHLGIGAKILLTDRVGLRVDGRAMVPASVVGKVVSIGDETEYGGPDFEAFASLYFAFGEVLRPTITREVKVVKEPALPNPDPDGDGIAGATDKCPEVAEDKDGFEDEDGCPEADNDKDGIPDASDKCPLKPENKNGIDDEDGCPEEDTDGDGFFGSRDKCPDQPENKNGYQDMDGCPDEIPVALRKYIGVIPGINFRTKSAKILRNSNKVLDAAVKVLAEFQDVKVEISGHTDSVGADDFNKKLSQDRAQSVKDYLVSKGIAADRLKSVGYGEDKPIEDNKTRAGRAKNRRTEFQLLNE